MATLLSSLETQARRHLLEPSALATPGIVVVTPQGTAGAATWTYKIVALNATGTTEAGPAGSTTTGNATLSATNYNQLTWAAVPNATGYWVYRTAVATSPTTTGRIAALGAVLTFNDTGIAGDGSTAATANTTVLSAPFWSSEELIDICNKGIKDLWGSAIDLGEEHWFTNDALNVSLNADSETLSGVPTDVFRVLGIEPRDISSGTQSRHIFFVKRDYNSREFISARSMSAQDANVSGGGIIYYSVTQAGAPVGAPVIYVAPQVTAALNLRLIYIPIQATVPSTGHNPIPGESDNALIAWIVAYGRAKERDDRSPDPNWLAVYGTEKQNIMVRLAPRDESEPDVVEGMFEGFYI